MSTQLLSLAMGVLRPPIAFVLARDEREVPGPDARWAYEPKFDGWRAALFTATGVVWSRRDNNVAKRVPEIVTAGRRLGDLSSTASSSPRGTAHSTSVR